MRSIYVSVSLFLALDLRVVWRAHDIWMVVINLGGYTKGARNDIFAARPCPVQLQLIGYAGTLGAGMLAQLSFNSDSAHAAQAGAIILSPIQ